MRTGTLPGSISAHPQRMAWSATSLKPEWSYRREVEDEHVGTPEL